MKKTTIGGQIVAILISLGFLVTGIVFGVNTYFFINNAESTTATIVDVATSSGEDGTTYTPIVEFKTTTGQTITSKSNVYTSSTPKIGNQVGIYYNPENPQSIKIDRFTDLYLFPLAFGGIGLIVFLAFAYSITKLIKKNKLNQQLKLTGTPIQTTFVELRRDTHTKPHRYYLVSKHETETGTRYFESDPLYGSFRNFTTPQHITVYINPQNPDEYYMEIPSI